MFQLAQAPRRDPPGSRQSMIPFYTHSETVPEPLSARTTVVDVLPRYGEKEHETSSDSGEGSRRALALALQAMLYDQKQSGA